MENMLKHYTHIQDVLNSVRDPNSTEVENLRMELCAVIAEYYKVCQENDALKEKLTSISESATL